MVAGPPARTKPRTMVMPITPPFAAIARMASSVLQRAAGTSARQLECVTSTGRRDATIASIVVRSPQCEMSIAIPS